MEQITNIIVNLVVAILGIYASCLAKKVVGYFEAKLTNEEQAKLENIVKNFVEAAEQMYKEEDEDGSKRLGYVQGLLVEAGYDLTDAIRAVIESQVRTMNQKNK